MPETEPFWTKLARARVSRRRALTGALAAAATAAAVTACGSGDEPADGAAGADEPVRGGELRYGTTVPFSGLDPQTETGTGLAIVARIFGYLLHVDPRDDSVIYDQAESAEQPDPLTYILRLRPGVMFHNVDPVGGRALTADDVVASIERFRKNALAPTRTFHTSVLDRVEAVDGMTVRLTTKRPYVHTLSWLGDISAGAILPVEHVRASTSLYTAAAGTGPFRVDEAAPPDSARLVRHDGYYRAPVPYLDAVSWRVFADPAARNAALGSAEVDAVPGGSRQELEALAAASPGIEVSAEPSLSSTALGIRTDRPPFSDPRVRQALDLAIDRDALIRDIAFSDGRILGPVNPELGAGYWSLFDDEVREAFGGGAPIDARRGDAAKLLVAAGAADAALRVQVPETPATLDLAHAIRDQLQRIGLRPEIEALDVLTWFTNFRRGAFEATLVTHLPYESTDIPLRFYHSQGPGATGSPFAFSDPAIDALVERSWGEANREARQATVRESQGLMLAARPLLPLFTAQGYSAAWDRVRNRRPGLLGSTAQYNYEHWLRPR